MCCVKCNTFERLWEAIMTSTMTLLLYTHIKLRALRISPAYLYDVRIWEHSDTNMHRMNIQYSIETMLKPSFRYTMYIHTTYRYRPFRHIKTSYISIRELSSLKGGSSTVSISVIQLSSSFSPVLQREVYVDLYVNQLCWSVRSNPWRNIINWNEKWLVLKALFNNFSLEKIWAAWS